MAASFRRVAIVGTGLIGGSFALALRKYSPGYRGDRLGQGACAAPRAGTRRDSRRRSRDLALAVAGADLIYVALPVGHTIELLPEIARLAAPDALVTDACSTKRIGLRRRRGIVSRRRRAFSGRPSDGRKGNFRDRGGRREFVSRLEIRADPASRARKQAARNARSARRGICRAHRKAGRGTDLAGRGSA